MEHLQGRGAGRRVVASQKQSLWDYWIKHILVNMARYRAPNLPHPEGAIRCSVKHFAKRWGCVASKYRHNHTIVYPFDPPVARTARRALPYNRVDLGTQRAVPMDDEANAGRQTPMNLIWTSQLWTYLILACFPQTSASKLESCGQKLSLLVNITNR